MLNRFFLEHFIQEQVLLRSRDVEAPLHAEAQGLIRDSFLSCFFSASDTCMCGEGAAGAEGGGGDGKYRVLIGSFLTTISPSCQADIFCFF